MLLDLLFHHMLTANVPMGGTRRYPAPWENMVPARLPPDPAPQRRRDEVVALIVGIL